MGQNLAGSASEERRNPFIYIDKQFFEIVKICIDIVKTSFSLVRPTPVYLHGGFVAMEDSMNQITENLLTCLVRFQRELKSTKTPDTVTPNDLTTYRRICTKAGFPQLTRRIGNQLGEVAEWCQARGLPHLNCLVVNAVEMKPGNGYKFAVGCSAETWWAEVKACLIAEYPATIQ